MSAVAYEPMFAPPPRKTVSEVTLNLPCPPSTNNLFVTVAGRKRVKSAKYTKWIAAAGWALVAQKPGRIEGQFSAEILIPSTSRADLDNLAKPVLDLCVKHGVVADDGPRFCRGVAMMHHDGADARVILRSVA